MDLGHRRLEVGPVPVQPEREGLPAVGAEPARADECVEPERSFELRGRGGVDLARCTHPSHPRIALISLACASGSASCWWRAPRPRWWSVAGCSRWRRRLDEPAAPTPFTTTPLTRTTPRQRSSRAAVLRRRGRPPGRGRARQRRPSSVLAKRRPDRRLRRPGRRRPRVRLLVRRPGREVAQAWVFAPPVDAPQAQRLVRSAGKGPGCQAGDGPLFGAPTLALSCTKDGEARALYRGLFGDAWLVCEVVRPVGATWDVRPGRAVVRGRAGGRVHLSQGDDPPNRDYVPRRVAPPDDDGVAITRPWVRPVPDDPPRWPAAGALPSACSAAHAGGPPGANLRCRTPRTASRRSRLSATSWTRPRPSTG